MDMANPTGKGGGDKRSKEKRDEDLRITAGLHLQGKGASEIAQYVEVSHVQVLDDLKLIRKTWREHVIDDIREYQNRELDRIDHLERVYWQAWERSTQPKRTERHKVGREEPDPEDEEHTVRRLLESTTTTTTRDGNPMFLMGIQWCIQARRELLGLDAPPSKPKDPPTGTGLRIPADVMQEREDAVKRVIEYMQKRGQPLPKQVTRPVIEGRATTKE